MKLNLTPLARHEAYLRLYSILTSLPIAKSAKKNDEDLKLERKLAAELIKNWRESYSSAMKDIFAAIPAELSAAAAEIIENGLLDALGTSFGSSQAVREQIKGFITKAYHETKNKFKAESSLSLADVRAINILSRHNCFWLGEHYGKHIGPKVSELTQKALDEGLGRDALAENLRQELGGAAPENYSYWDVAASAALVRARSFGAISGMEEAGIAEYEILAMGDERMCPICGEMNGKHFSVAKTREVIDKVLDITAPEKFKDAMPWQSKPPAGKSEAELLSGGQSLPPFHGRCRCTLVMVSETQNMPEDPRQEVIEKINKLQEERLKYQHELEQYISQTSNVDVTHALVINNKQYMIDQQIKKIKIEAAEKKIILATGLEKTLSKTEVDYIVGLVKNAPEDVRKVWNLFEDKMSIADLQTTSTPCYSPVAKAIYIDIIDDRVSKSERPAYSTMFHELGHLIDNAVGKDYAYISDKGQHNLYDTLKSEIDKNIRSTLKQLKSEALKRGDDVKSIDESSAYNKITIDLWCAPRGSTMAVSDMFAGVTKGKMMATYGHDAEYWNKNPRYICLEFFAQEYSDLIVNPQGVEVTKRYMPKSHAIFKKILKDIIDDNY